MAKTKTLSIEEVQKHAASLRGELASIAERLRVLQGTVEPHLPAAKDADAMTAQESPASVAWEVHGWLGEAESAVRDAVETLEKASAATEDTLLGSWLRRLCDSDDHTAFEILSREFSREFRGDGEVLVPLPVVAESDAKSVRRALVLRMAERLYKEKTGGGVLDLRQGLREGYEYTRGIRVSHLTRVGSGARSLCGRGQGEEVPDGRIRPTCKACLALYEGGGRGR